jgi:cardiolipin synthase
LLAAVFGCWHISAGLENTTTTQESVLTGQFEWLGTVDLALEKMLQAIEAAQKSVRFEVYIFRASPIGESFRDALVRAVQRGVKVQVLNDALGSIALPESFWAPMVEAGGAFRWFNPLKLKRLSFRNHRKSLICDDSIAFVGGFNVAPEYQGDGVTKGWHEVGMVVSETLARELAAAFDALFALADYRHRRFSRFRKSRIQRIASTRDGQLLLTGPSAGPHVMMGALLSDARKARAIDLISAYFLPPRQFRRTFSKLARAGGRVRLVMAGKSDVALAQLAARQLYQSFLNAGVEIYEYQPQILHTKLFLFDDVVYVGSANLDKRSLYINYELLVRLSRAEVTGWAREFFDQTLSHCVKIDPRTWGKSRNLWSKLREQWAYLVLSRVDPYLSQLQMTVLRRDLQKKNTPADF